MPTALPTMPTQSVAAVNTQINQNEMQYDENVGAAIVTGRILQLWEKILEAKFYSLCFEGGKLNFILFSIDAVGFLEQS